ncbi:hypothetical protein RDV84_08435 [Lysobacter yananisis]|uniref:HEPN AbiU2-like domain-containing protein n=1 Tax=Lysobacter yananisis TaxID=1003114 RepID=A0ABY9PCP6_9GAMM|nr:MULTISPECIES: hypothetical protein [Lysobacter]QCW28286.1 hypothetical protein FE772_24205 [Lysobacter enzymogenes]WMT04853.1 hypothetical protein RDV84_08435 [Lysobacter yananisis]
MKQADYIRYDTESDAISSVELASIFFLLSLSDERYWKWFVVALHSGLQGALVLALRHGDSLLVQKPGTAKKMLEAWSTNEPSPLPYMDNLTGLYQKLSKTDNPHPIHFAIEQKVEFEAAISKIDSTRHDLLHFNSKSWSIGKNYLREEALLACKIIAALCAPTSTIVWHDEEGSVRMQLAVTKLNKALRDEA